MDRFIKVGSSYIENDSGSVYRCTAIDDFEYVLKQSNINGEDFEKRISIYHGEQFFKKNFRTVN